VAAPAPEQSVETSVSHKYVAHIDASVLFYFLSVDTTIILDK
jgi:hypothetical protein